MDLLILGHDGSISRVALLPTGRISIGRSNDQTIVLPDTRVSRRHLALEPVEGTWFASDQGSANGTFLNGVRVTSAVSLRAGDVLDFGDSHAQLVDTGAPAPAVATATIDGVTTVPPGELAEMIASANQELAARRQSLLARVAEAQRNGLADLLSFARIIADAIDVERLAFFAPGGDRPLRPLLSAPTDDDATTLLPIADMVVRTGCGCARRTPRIAGEPVGPSTPRPSRRLEGFVLAAAAGAGVIALEACRPAPVREREELALLFAFGLGIGKALGDAAANHPAFGRARDLDSTFVSIPVHTFLLKRDVSGDRPSS